MRGSPLRTSIVASAAATLLMVIALAAAPLMAAKNQPQFTWNFWIQTPWYPTPAKAVAELNRERPDAERFLSSRGLTTSELTIEPPRVDKISMGLRNVYIASQRLYVVTHDYRRFATLSGEVELEHQAHRDWSSSFPDNGASWQGLFAAALVLLSLVSGVYVLSTSEIGRTYSSTLPPATGKGTDPQSKRMHPGFVAVQTLGLGSSILLCLMYWLIDYHGAKTAFAFLVLAELAIAAAWLIWTNANWAHAEFFKRARAAYWFSLALVALAFTVSLVAVG